MLTNRSMSATFAAPIAGLCLLAGWLVFAATPALALPTHSFSTSFGGSGSSALAHPQGVAIDQSTGEVYVVDSGNDRVEIFSASGTFISAFGTAGTGSGQFKEPSQIAVDNSGGLPGNVYVLDNGNERVEVFSATGEYRSQIVHSDLAAIKGLAAGSATAIAVDPSGNLWIYDSAENMYEFPGGALPGVFHFRSPYGASSILAVNASGDLYIGDGRFVSKFGPLGELLAELTEEQQSGCACTTGVALDPVTEDVYVDSQVFVAHFPASNTGFTEPTDLFGSTGTGALVAGAGIAVRGSTGAVYVADVAANRVDVFIPSTVADVTLEAPTAVTKTTAVLHGTVNPAGIEVTSCKFEWGTEAGVFPNTAPCSPAPGSGTTEVHVSAQLALAPATTYHYRLTVTDANGTNRGPKEEESFMTPPAVDALSTGPAENISATGAKLTGSLSPDGTDARYYFQYGPCTKERTFCSGEPYVSTSPALPGTDAGSASASVPAETTLAGLAANTTYHYRLVGVNSFGATDGEGVQFLTPGPPTINSEAAEVTPTEKVGQTHATLQAQIDPDGRETTYRFEYGETSSYGISVPVPSGTIGSGEEPVSVPPGELGALKLGTTYHYRVVASNVYGTTDGPDQQFTTLPAALIEEGASGVGATSATLQAQINPLGSDTSYYFQYGTQDTAACTASTCLSVPVAPGEAIGSGEISVKVSRHLQGLAPGTLYHYRVVAVNGLGGADGPDQTFTTQESGSGLVLPDARQWELVSPPDAHGALFLPIREVGLIQSSAAGDALSYLGVVPTETGPKGYGAEVQILSNRGGGGWSSQVIALPHVTPAPPGLGAGTEYRFFSDDLTRALVEPRGEFTSLAPEVSPPDTERTLYIRNDATCATTPATCFQPLVTGAPGYADVPKDTKFGGYPTNLTGEVLFDGGTPDLAHVIVSSAVRLTPTPTGQGGLYEWSAASPAAEALQLVSVLPASEGGAAVSAGFGSGNQEGSVRGAISTDGSRVFWTRLAPGGHLYLRETGKRETLKLDAVQPGVSEGGRVDPKFQGASSDGSLVFFTDEQRLTSDAGASEKSPDLYECAIRESAGKLQCELTDLTPASSGEGAHAVGVSGVSEDGSYVYFVADGALAPNAVHGTCESALQGVPQPGEKCNLFVRHGGMTTLVAVLSDQEYPDYISEDVRGLAARVSPNGRYLAFMSNRSLTGYDNHDANSGAPDQEVFLYDARTNHLVCASCNPTGARPVGLPYNTRLNAGLAGGDQVWYRSEEVAGVGHAWLAANIPGYTPAGTEVSGHQSRYLSNEGRLFFNSSDALVSQDVNNNEDVYQYEPPASTETAASDSCTTSASTFSERSGGCVSLISSGTAPGESAFLDASENGDDVFFLSGEKLVAKETATTLSVYDAHACTGQSPCVSAPANAPACTTADACRSAPVPQPSIFGSPSSATFSGAGNVVPSGAVRAVKPKSLTRTQRLARALKACRREKPKARRVACEKRARKKYGSTVKSKSRKGSK